MSGGAKNKVNALPDIELTEAGKKAEILYKLYERPGWWNNYGMDEFTTADFLGLMLEYDISAEVNATNLIIEAVGRQIWTDASGFGGHQPYCEHTPCRNGILNFIGVYIQSAQTRFSLTEINPKDLPYNKENGQQAIESARKIGNSILNPPVAWTQYSDTAPYHWGNDPTPQWALQVPYSESMIGSAPNQVYYHGGANFIVYSIVQDNYWSSLP